MKTSEAICDDARISTVRKKVQLNEVKVEIITPFRHQILWDNGLNVREWISDMIQVDCVRLVKVHFLTAVFLVQKMWIDNKMTYDPVVVFIHFPSSLSFIMFFGKIIGLQKKEPTD